MIFIFYVFVNFEMYFKSVCRRGNPEVCKSAGTRTTYRTVPGTSPLTVSRGTSPPSTKGNTWTKKPTTPTVPVQTGTTVSRAAGLTGSSGMFLSFLLLVAKYGGMLS